MIKNYLKIAWRNFRRNTAYSLINLLGLAIGLGSLILISLFVTNELSYDDFHKRADRIHYVGLERTYGGNTSKSMSTPYPVGKAMAEEIPKVDHFVTTLYPGSGKISTDGEDFHTEDHIILSSKDFFQVFSFPLKVGNPETVLADPKAVVLTEEMARKYFPNENPIGRTITIERYGQAEFTVTGIAQNMAHNSYVSFDFVASILNTDYSTSYEDAWGASMFNTYVQLQEGSKWEDIAPQLAEIVVRQLGEEADARFFSIPLQSLYLSEYSPSQGFKGDKIYVYIFSAIALFILLLACINYMNLATARALQRAREVGIRKVVGAEKSQLIFQFIGEAVLVSTLAFFIGLFLAEVSLPFFNHFLGNDMGLTFSDNKLLLVSLFFISIAVGIIAGSYPAFFLSRFSPSSVLKSDAPPILKGGILRKSLVVFQFLVSAVLIICTLTAFSQLRYVLNKDLGFTGEQVLYIPVQRISGQLETFKQLALSHSAVIQASATTGVPGRYGTKLGQAYDPKASDNHFYAYNITTDDTYDDVLNLTLLAGRYFDENRGTDGNKAVVVNEAMLDKLGWESPKNAINRPLADSSTVVIGVVKDFHFSSLHKKIEPLYIETQNARADRSNEFSFLMLRFNPEQVQQLISYLQKEWNTLSPKDPLTYYFLDEKFEELYQTDQKLMQAFSAFAGISIFIACLGLFGLAAFSAEKRTKEIGIRKVLGASVTNIVALLSKDFVKLVLIGFVIAIPIAWYAMNRWLADFAYKIEIGPGIFVLAGAASLLIALLTVSWQSIKAAVANPVESLKSE